MSSLSLSLLQELDTELALSRKTIERVPSDKLDFTPHPKSMSIGRLAAHVAQMPQFGALTLTTSEFDLSGFTEPEGPKSTEELVKIFDHNAAEFRSAVQAATDESMEQNWTLRNGEQVLFAMPRAQVMRGMIVNHLVHHRGQLTVYLRLLDVPLPAMYGPSADEAN